MKYIITILFIISFSFSNAQEALAKIEFAAAETEYQAGNYAKSLEHLETVKEMLSSTNSTVMYLEILSRNEIFEKLESLQTDSVEEKVALAVILDNLSSTYISSFQNSVPIEKLSEVYEVNKKFKGTSRTLDDLKIGMAQLNDKDWRQAQITLTGACTVGNPIACSLVIIADKYLTIQELRLKTLSNISSQMVPVDGGIIKTKSKVDLMKPFWEQKNGKKITVESFRIAKFELTKAIWFAVMDPEKFIKQTEEMTPAMIKDFSRYPQFQITPAKALEFISKLNEVTGLKFRLPTKSEWEYAASGGKNGESTAYAGSSNLKTVGRYKANHDLSVLVGSYLPNELGIYDMSGNLYEICLNDNESQKSNYVIKGGAYDSSKKDCKIVEEKSIQSDENIYEVGLRLAMDAQ